MLLRGTVPPDCSWEESFSRSNISPLAQQEINSESVLIDSAIEISPSSVHSDVGFLHTPRCTYRSCVATPALRKLGDIALDPPEDCCMRDSDTALGHHLDEVAVAQLIGDIPSDAENNDCAVEVSTTKQGRCVRGRLIHATDYQPNSVFAPTPSF